MYLEKLKTEVGITVNEVKNNNGLNQKKDENSVDGQLLFNKSKYLQQHPMIKEIKPIRLLVIEDNPGDYLLLKKKLFGTAIPIEAMCRAERLSDVEAILKEHEIDLVFLDLTLPDSTGIDSFITLNDLLPHIPIIVLSGLSDMEVALETISIGAQDYLMKGEFDEKLLAKSIQYSFERKKTLKKLNESNQRFEYVTQATFDAVWDCKLETNELYWAENFKTLFGHNSGTEADNFKLWEKLLHPGDRERIINKLDEVLESKESNWVEEYRFQKADGQFAYVSDKAIVLRDAAGKAFRLIGAMQDITRQKEEEQTLKLFQSVIVNANDGVLITDISSNQSSGPKVTYVNEAMTRITGYSKEDWMGQPLGMLYGPKTETKELERLRRAMEKWESCEIEALNYKKNGEEFWMNFSVVPISNNKGRFTHWIAIARDVTERRNHTKAIEEQNIRLKEIAWMQSHTVRAPLARIMALVNAIDDCEAMNMKVPDLLSYITESAHELDGVIREIVTKSSAIRMSEVEG